MTDNAKTPDEQLAAKATEKKLTKKQRRKKAQRRNLLAALAIVLLVALIVGGVVIYNKVTGDRIDTLPHEQRVTAVVNGQETEIAPFSACQLDDPECRDSEPFELEVGDAKEFTLKIPKDVYDHDWAMLEIYNDPGANDEHYYGSNETTEVTVPLESERKSKDGSTPKLAVAEIHSLMVGLDENEEQSPYNVVWSISPKR